MNQIDKEAENIKKRPAVFEHMGFESKIKKNYLKVIILFSISFLAIVSALMSVSGCAGTNLKFNKPTSFCITSDESKLIIFDSQNARILIAGDDFKFIREIRHPYITEYASDIWGVSLTDKNEIVVPNNRYNTSFSNAEEKKRNAIVEFLFFNFSGELVDRLHWEGEKGPVVLPIQTTWLSDGTFWVTDARLNRCVKMNRKGDVLKTFGKPGKNPGEMYLPHEIDVAADGNLILSDRYNSRLQLFSPEGSFIKIVAEKGETEGCVMFPQRLTVDREGNIYCSELETMRISVFDRNYRFFKKLVPELPPEKKSGDVFFHLNDMCVLNKRGLFLALDQHNSLIHIFDKTGKWIKAVDGLIP